MGEDGAPTGTGLRTRPGRLGLVICAVVAVPLVLVAGSVPGAVLGGCDTVEHSPNAGFSATYSNGTLSLTHAGGDALPRDAARRTTVLVGDDDRASYAVPTDDGPFPLIAGDTVRVANVTLNGDRLRTGDRVEVRYEKRVDYPAYCLHRSEHLTYLDGRLADNGSVV